MVLIKGGYIKSQLYILPTQATHTMMATSVPMLILEINFQKKFFSNFQPGKIKSPNENVSNSINCPRFNSQRRIQPVRSVHCTLTIKWSVSIKCHVNMYSLFLICCGTQIYSMRKETSQWTRRARKKGNRLVTWNYIKYIQYIRSYCQVSKYMD